MMGVKRGRMNEGGGSRFMFLQQFSECGYVLLQEWRRRRRKRGRSGKRRGKMRLRRKGRNVKEFHAPRGATRRRRRSQDDEENDDDEEDQETEEEDNEVGDVQE